MPDEYVNLHVRILRSKRNKLTAYIPHGLRDKIFRVLVDEILEICEEGSGPDFIKFIMSKYVTLTKDGFEVTDAKLPNNE